MFGSRTNVCLAVAGSDRLHDLRQHLRPWPQRLVLQEGQRGVGHVQIGYEIGAFGVEVDQTGEELVPVTALLQELKGRAAVGDVVLLMVKARSVIQEPS